jgi:hypothetical protein
VVVVTAREDLEIARQVRAVLTNRSSPAGPTDNMASERHAG